MQEEFNKLLQAGIVAKKKRTYCMVLHYQDIQVECPVQLDGNKPIGIISPAFKLPYRKYPVFVYLYAKHNIVTALGMEAIRKGYSIRFRRACDLATQLAEAQSEKRLSSMLKTLHHCQLLIVDELGYMTLDQKNSNLLFQVLAGRYEVRSTIVTSKLLIADKQKRKTLDGRGPPLFHY